jgi:hypothetical protein
VDRSAIDNGGDGHRQPGWRRLVISVAKDKRLSQLAVRPASHLAATGTTDGRGIALRAWTGQASLRSNTQP